jgi:type II secretory pathway pseudopilin PulG
LLVIADSRALNIYNNKVGLRVSSISTAKIDPLYYHQNGPYNPVKFICKVATMIGRRKLLIFMTLATLSLLVIVVNKYLSTNLTENDEFVHSTQQQQQQQQQQLQPQQQQQQQQQQRQRKTLNSDVTTSTLVTPSRRKVDFVKSSNAIISQSYDPFKSKEKKKNPEKSNSFLSSDGTRYIPQHRVVHLDLKGAPPKLNYLKSIFPLLKDAGATALLIEYEDMFPFWGPLRNASAKNAYSAGDIQSIQLWAAQNDLTVIPLIQTFGHLEFALKLNDFKHLREVPIYPQSICPSNDESWKLITQIIDQGN